MIFFWYSVSVYISVSAQNLTPEILACSESAQARYACFKKGRKGEFERAKDIESIRRSARDTKEELLLVSIMHSKRQCEKLSSGNNAANKVFTFPKYFSKMRKYFLTYGYMVELKPISILDYERFNKEALLILLKKSCQL